MTAIIGLDPGLSGAVGIIDHTGRFIASIDMPHENKVIDTDKLWSEIAQSTAGMDKEFVLEIVHAMPKQGVVSVFNFGMAYMAAISVAQRSRWPTHYYTPQKWKKALGLTSDKKESLKMARELWPQAPLKLAKHDGRAESLLIAEFFRREMYVK
jgi:crossover junction endodeoxyribonuclease RuvC